MRKASNENLLLMTKLNRASALATSIDTAELLGMQINQLSLRGHLLSFQTPHTLPKEVEQLRSAGQGQQVVGEGVVAAAAVVAEGRRL